MKQFIIAMAVLSMLSACKESQRREGTAMYKTITVEPTNRTLKSGYTATLRGRQFVEVRPQVSGIITEIKINEGDAVHKGQTLFIIDQVPYKAALETVHRPNWLRLPSFLLKQGPNFFKDGSFLDLIFKRQKVVKPEAGNEKL